jgi:hypothetical protein
MLGLACFAPTSLALDAAQGCRTMQITEARVPRKTKGTDSSVPEAWPERPKGGPCGELISYALIAIPNTALAPSSIASDNVGCA